MDSYNLHLLQKLFTHFTPQGQITNIQHWHTFLDFLYINQLIDPKDLLKIKDSVIYFPVYFENLQKIILNSNILLPLVDLSQNLDSLLNQINDCRTTLKRWNYQTFSIEDMLFTTKTYEEILQEFQDFKNEFDHFANDVIIINQPIQSIKAMVSSFPIPKIDPTQFLVEMRDKIEREYNRIRIKSVQYRNQPIKILKLFDNSIQIQVGFDQIKDAPVEVWLIPVKMWRQQEQCQILNTFEAHHELILSPVFPNYLGQNLLSDSNNYQHFMELTRGHTLRYLRKNKQKKHIDPNGPFFRTAMKQVFVGLYDILRMTRFQPSLPITLSNIQVANEGLKIYLKNVRFTELRDNSLDLEATLLENFAQIIMSCLGLTREQIGQLGKYLIWKNLLEGLFNAEEDHILNERGVVQNRLTFAQLMGHDLFDEELLAHFEIQHIIKDFKDIYQL